MDIYNIYDLIDIGKIQEMFSDFHEATGYSVGMIAVNGEILVKSGWQEICEKYHRKEKHCLENCIKSDETIQKHLETEGFYDYKCLNGLVDSAIPVIIGDQHLASVFFGQFFYDDDIGREEDFRDRAKKYGFDETAYIEAYHKIPVYSREQVKHVMRFCKTVVDMIIESGTKNLMLKEELEKELEYEKKLEEQGKYLDSIYNGAEVSIFVMDVSEDGRFIYRGLNRNHEKTSGFKSEDLEGKTPDDLIEFMPLEAINAVKRHYQDCVDACKSIQYEEMIPMLGKEIWWLTTLTPIYNSEGRLHRIIGSAICINQLKEVQHELKRHKENLEEIVAKKTDELRATNDNLQKEIEYRKRVTLELQHSEEQYRRIFSSVSNAIFIIDDSGIIVETNPAASEIYGYKKEELIGLPVAKLIRQDYHGELERFTKTIQAGKEFKGETIDVCKDGGELFSLVTGKKIVYRGRFHFMAVITDITQIKEIEKKLQSSNEELEQFAYVASHDLQEPLRKISSFIELIRQKYDNLLDEKGKRFMGYVIDGSQRMQKQISGLLEFSRVKTRAKPFTGVDLNAIMRNVLANLDMIIEEKHAKISYDFLPEILADETQIYSLLQNLISNALKFCRCCEPVVMIKYEEKDFEWEFSVKDNGMGIDEEDHKKVFMIFQRLHDRTEIPGTGIGLAMCKKIVERHGGKIWLESQPGKGATFYFTIAKGLSQGDI